MRDAYDLPADAPGAYMPVRSDRSVPFGKFYRPHHLPPDLTLSQETILLVERASHALGRLDGFRSQIENADTILRPLLYKEAEQSSQVEGTQVTTTDLYRATASGTTKARSRDVQEALNYVDALQTAADQLLERGRSRSEITLELVHQLHETVMEAGKTDEADPLPGQFRPDYAWIEESTEPWKQSIRFVPPKAAMVDSLMDGLLDYLQSPSEYPVLVDVALIHYQFETIHPFKDGNGRVGRLLVLLLLVACDVLTEPVFHVSSYIKAHREEYTDRLLGVSEAGEWEAWVQFFLAGMETQAEAVLSRAALLSRLHEQYQDQYATAPASIQHLVDVLFEQPFLTVPRAAEGIDMSYPAANDAVQTLVDEGVLLQVSDTKRNREFVATEIMEIVERDADALPDPAEVLESRSG